MRFLQHFRSRGLAALSCVGMLGLGSLMMRPTPVRAADHGDSPAASQDIAADIGDIFFFLDPNDNTKAIIAGDVHGFTVPAENENLGFFDPLLRFRFAFENTGDAKPDAFIDVTFSPQIDRNTPQTATIQLPNGHTIQAPTTLSTAKKAAANAPVVMLDPLTGVSFFAGLTDDPFFFDIPAELKYRASRIANAIDPSFFSRARDSFAGYNINMVALRVPVSLIRGAPSNNVIGMNLYVQRPQSQVRTAGTGFALKTSSRRAKAAAASGAKVALALPRISSGPLVVNSDGFVTVDRMGIPAVNTVFISFKNKDAYNRANTEDDANGVFAADIVSNLQKLQTDATSIGILAGLAVTKGDFLRLDLTIPNTGLQGGTNPAAAFPNGRRPTDDIIDTIVTLVNNRVFQGDNVNANDVPFRDTFPFFAAAKVPFPGGTVDDFTRN